MQFHDLNQKLREHVAAKFSGQPKAFVVNTDNDALWEHYLDSFPREMNQIFRQRREFDCSCCRNFIKNFGATVIIGDDLELTTIWDFDAAHPGYQQMLNAMSAYVRSAAIQDAWVRRETTIGTERSTDNTEDGRTLIWNHFHIRVPVNLVYSGHATADSVRSELRTTRQMLERAFTELSADAIAEVRDMISEKIIYRGEQWTDALAKFAEMQNIFFSLDDSKRNNYLWLCAANVPESITRIRNHSIGVLLQDISEGMNVDAALARYESVVAPQNYQRPKGVYTQRQIEAARAEIERLGFANSLHRRFAELRDISVQDVIFADTDARPHMQEAGLGGIMSALASQIDTDPQQYARSATPVEIEQFLAEVVPGATSIELLVESRHDKNFMSLVAPVNASAPSMFTWGNNFSWVYNGNITDSMRERVKAAGGKIDGALRFSIQWSGDGSQSDLDAHCSCPMHHIYFGSKVDLKSGGNLDVDHMLPRGDKPVVENIVFPRLDRMSDGKYDFSVHGFAVRKGESGFSAEIEFSGKTYEFQYDKPVRQGEYVTVATVTLKDGEFSILTHMPSISNASRSTEVWGINTNRFHKVSLVCLSPNYWGGTSGNKHYMFAIPGVINPERPSGFFNEYLKPELRPHRQVFEALTRLMKCEPNPNQVSGLGFNSTTRNNVLARINGNRIYNVIF